MAKRFPPMTAAELTAKLEADPDYVARSRARDEHFARIGEALAKEEIPLLSELRAAGYDLKSVWDLVNTSTPYPEALPILLKHLTLPYSDRTREGIARALAVKPASFAWPFLVEEYRKAPMGRGVRSPVETEPALLGIKDGLAVALSITVTDATIGELVDLAKDPSHGESRVLLLWGIRRSRHPIARAAIEELAHDPQLSKEIASWRRSKRAKARPTH